MNNAKKKDKAPIIIAICVAALIAAAVLFIVTKGFQNDRTDPNKARFERELGEKYGEEFVCLKLETRGMAIDPPVVMDAICAPARDQSLIFNAQIFLDLNSTENTDCYPYELARQQITEEFSDKICGIWHGFTAFCFPIFFIENDDIVARIKEGTFNWRYYAEHLCSIDNETDYIDTTDYANFEFVIIVDSSYNNVSYKDEWNALQKVIEEWLAEFRQKNIYLGLNFTLYFPPPELYAECAEIVRNIPMNLGVEYNYLSMLDEKLDEERIIEFCFDQYIVDEVGYTRVAEAYVEAREEMG